MKKSVSILVCLLFSANAFSQTVDKKGVQVQGMHISAGAIQLVGTILTASSEDKKGAVAIGWTLILLGSFSQGGDISFGAELYNKETEVALYGDGQTSANTQVRANVKKVLQETEMEALIAANDPQLASGLTISEFARSLNVSSERLGQLVISGKSFADGKLNRAQFASTRVSVSKSELTASTGQLSESEMRVISNYLRLRNISVI
ncbi:MAG: hypothetical protein IPL83_01425 [Bdellovibrionales bacterium]|nr:hypothetical protein [Bdellovibrionales bacterium]